MKPKTFMLIAGEPSGDMLGAELVRALRREFAAAPPVITTDYQPLETSLEPRFFGAGGSQMAAAGVDLAFDMTEHSVIGLSAVSQYLKFYKLARQLLRIARERKPDALICVDFAGFNRRFAHAIATHARNCPDSFQDWRPRIIQYVSPQVWASRESRANLMARDYDLLLSIFPFEKHWYAKRTPKFHVEFVGHPLVDRYQTLPVQAKTKPSTPTVLLLPGSRPGELVRHLPVMLGALPIIRKEFADLRPVMVLPNELLVAVAKECPLPEDLQIRTSGLPEALAEATIAIASTGTVTVECAFFQVPTVALYKTSWITFQVGKRIIKVRYLAMPNLLTGEEVFPEFIQDAATPQNIAKAALDLLKNEPRRNLIKKKLAEIVALLGPPGASARAARAIVELLKPNGQT